VIIKKLQIDKSFCDSSVNVANAFPWVVTNGIYVILLAPYDVALTRMLGV
jgi:hypothetical protein